MYVESHSNDKRWIFEHEYPSIQMSVESHSNDKGWIFQIRICFEYECLSNLTQMITDGYSNMNILRIRMSAESH
jgi:hypothetical protein